MASETKQLLAGAALAAILVIPAADASSAEDRSWVASPAQSFAARVVDLEHVFADVTINVAHGAGPLKMTATGPKYLVAGIQSHADGTTLIISGPQNAERNISVWDVSKWFDYSDVGDDKRVKITLSVPRGTDVTAHKMIGDLKAGDLDSKVWIETSRGDVNIGRVREAHLNVVGSGDIAIGAVSGPLQLDIAGSGDIKVGSSQSANVSIAGSGDTVLGAVNGGLKADIAGSGDLSVASVNGPVNISMAGAGDAHINSGHATPLKVSIVGAGDFGFGGAAVDPTISAIGSGDVWIRSYTGKLSSSGMADVTIGEQKSGGWHPTPPAPPAPPALPAPPAPPKPAKPVKPAAPMHRQGGGN